MSYFGSLGRKTVRIIVSIDPTVSTVLLSTKSPVQNFTRLNKDFCPCLCAAGDSLRYYLMLDYFVSLVLW